MAYQALIDKQLVTAFNLAKDLAPEIVFKKTTAAGFNFGTAAVEKVQSPPVIIKAVVVDQKKPSKSTNHLTKTVMIKSADIEDLNAYDEITFENKQWKISNIIKGVGRIWIFEMTSGAQ